MTLPPSPAPAPASPRVPASAPLRLARREQLARWAMALAVPALVIAYHARAAAPGQAFIGYDLRNFFYAIREATAAALRAGHLPGWQRGFFLGYPLLADPQAGLFDLGTWLTLPWRNAARALTLSTLLHLCIAGWGMLYWLRLRRLGRAEALLGAVLFALGAKETVHLQHWNFAASTAWWPWMLAGLEGFTERGRGRYLLLTALAAASSWFGGAAQMAYFGTLVACAYALALAPRLWRRRRPDALLALVAAPLGLALAAPLILPVAELARYGPRGAGIAYAFATSWKWLDRWGLALLLLPRSFGGAWGQLQEMNLWEATGYLGILPLGLAAAAPLRRRGTWIFALLGAIGVWLCWGEDAWLGIHRAFYELLPGFGAFRNPTRALMVTSLASALLAAEGMAALRAPGASRGRFARAAAVLAAIAVAVFLLPRFHSFSLDRAAAKAGAHVAAALALAGLLWLAATWHFGARTRLHKAWALLPCALAFIDLHHAFADMNTVGPAAAEVAALADLAPALPAAPAPRRVAVIAQWGRTANAPLRRGWEGVTGYGPTVIQRVRSLLEATASDRVVPPAPVDKDTNFPRPVPTSALWPLLGSPLVVSDLPWLLPVERTVTPEWSEATYVYRAPALPRVFWAGAFTAAADDRVAAPLLRAARGDEAVLAEEAMVSAFTISGPPEGPVAARDVRVEGGALEAVLEAPRAGAAVVLEPWFPGWSATVDGAAAPIARADFAFMAVPMPEGRHALRLTYRNTRLARGFAVAAITLALLGAALAWRRASGSARRAAAGASKGQERRAA